MTNLQVGEFNKFKSELEIILKGLNDRITSLEEENKRLVVETRVMKTKFIDLETKIGDYDNEIIKINRNVEEVNSKTVPQTRLFSSLFDNIPQDDFEINIINAVKTNSDEERSKEKNVLIFGTKFNENDDENNILKAESETSPILVELKTRGDKLEVLRNAKNLRNSSQFEKVFIGPDQTLAERTYTKGLIKKRNEEKSRLTDGCGFRYATIKVIVIMSDFCANINSNEADIIMISETWFKTDSIVNINGFNIYKKDRKSRGGGVCIYVKNDIKSYELSDDLDEYSELEHIWCVSELIISRF
ncbi:unnamed protein product [Brachionus calyciflorus]|uniref:Uncharacterized protein n=1 Tax=Brachionus calyciflorus TaxID=104777 RepID=A0A814PG23_9BILA|nr:unnamed protein product [Brachionus calyciflorus]